MYFKGILVISIISILAINTIDCQFYVDIEKFLPRIGKRLSNTDSSTEITNPTYDKGSEKEIEKRNLIIVRLHKALKNFKKNNIKLSDRKFRGFTHST